MKVRVWVCIILVVSGSALLGYYSGHYHALRQSQIKAHRFLNEFIRSTGVLAYLEERDQHDWSKRLSIYPIAGKESYIHSRRDYNRLMLFGLATVSLGLVGFGFAIGRLTGSSLVNRQQ